MSDETLRRAGRAELDRLNAESLKKAAVVPKAKRKQVTTSLSDVLGIGKSKERRMGPSGDSVDDVVDKAIKGAKPDPY